MSASRSVRSASKLTYSETSRMSFAFATSVGMYAVVSETTATRDTAAEPTGPTSYTGAGNAGVRHPGGLGPPRRANARDRAASRGAQAKRGGAHRRARGLRPAPGGPGDGDLRAGARRDDDHDPRGGGAAGERGPQAAR